MSLCSGMFYYDTAVLCVGVRVGNSACVNLSFNAFLLAQRAAGERAG